MVGIELSNKELAFILALLEATNRQTALQLLAAEHFYRPTLLPKLRDAEKAVRAMNNLRG